MMDGNHSTPELESLLAWAKSNGGFIDNRLVLLSGEKSGSTCYTTATIPPSTKLITIPHTLVISYSRAQSELPIQLSHNEPPVNHFSVLSAFLALEQLKGTESFWYPYIATLPSIKKGCGGPMFQTNDAIDARLGGTNLGVSMVENIKEDWRQDWKCIKELLRSIEGWETKAEGLTWELYLWAASMFASRAFPDKLLSWDKTSPTTLSAPQLGAQTNTDGTIQYIQSGVANGSKPALFPLLDILNHKPRTKITWNPGENEIGFTGEVFLDKGVEVFNNYGPKSNQQLLLSYGFTIRDNPDDAVMLKFKPVLDPVRQAIRDKQISQKDDVGIYYLMASDPTLPQELIQLFRLIVANQWELEALFESPTNPIIGRNELAAKTQILKSLKMKRQSHCRIHPDPDRGYDEDPQFNAYATIFKEGQIMILDAAISNLQNELRELYSRCILISVDDLIASSRDFQTAICTCFGDEEYQAESGMDQVSAMLAISNLRRIYEKGKKCPENQAKELIQRYPMETRESEEEEARVCELYDQIFPAAAEAVPHFFGDKRWTLDLIRWGSRVYQGEVVTLFVDGGELQKDYLVFSGGQGLGEDSSG